MTTQAHISPFSQTFWWVIDGGKYYGQKAIDVTYDAGVKAKPYFVLAAEKTQHLWQKTSPYITTFVEFMKSPPGIVLALLVVTVILMKLSEHVKNEYFSTAFLVLGIACAIFTGAFMQHMKLIVHEFFPSDGVIRLS